LFCQLPHSFRWPHPEWGGQALAREDCVKLPGMKHFTLGRSGPRVAALGLGCMGMSGMYGAANREESIATLRAAMDAGINLIDTGDFYGMGHNELLVGDCLKGRRREELVLSVKFGALRDPTGSWMGFDARPAAVKTFLAYSLQRLRVDYIDIYRPARLDPQVPIEETIGAIADAVKAGWVRHIGLSEVGAQTIRRAAAVHPICDLQIEYSLLSRGIETEILPVCRELGIGITAYGVLSRGLISGHWSNPALPAADIRSHMPRFQAENLQQNLQLVERLRPLASSRGVGIAQLAIAWVAAQGADILPVIGSRRRDQLAAALAAANLTLTPDELATLDQLLPRDAAAGERYGSAQMAHLDSEKRHA
jgi:aryl-alcohol dehydrogenase-like predicted oxidoreductase